MCVTPPDDLFEWRWYKGNYTAELWVVSIFNAVDQQVFSGLFIASLSEFNNPLEPAGAC